MQKRSLIVLGLGLVIAVGTAMSLMGRIKQEKAPQAVSQVLIATADISAGSFVRADAHLKMSDWPKDAISPNMITPQTGKAQDFDGSVARRAIEKGEPIVKNLLVKSNEGGFMSAVLEPGKRAVSISVDSTTGNAGFIFPGDRVDLILTHAVTRQTVQTRASETFVEDVRVLAVDQMLENPDNKAVLAKTVTLEVTPKQAEEINLAKDLGKISLSLRSLARNAEQSKVISAAEPESIDDILRASKAAEESAGGFSDKQNLTRDTEVSKIISPLEAAGGEVTLIRGDERTVVQFGPNKGSNGE